jgi:MoaA/NifB/PqqE/SkfB family radical SAM enzyme
MPNPYADRDFEKERREWKPIPETDTPGGFAPPPRHFHAQLTLRCNLRCRICGQWGVRGMHRERKNHPWLNEMPVEDWKTVIDQLESTGCALCFWGGEPLLFRGAVELIIYAKSKGIPTNIITNGVLLEPHAETLVRTGLDRICISIDGTEKVHEKVRGVPGIFAKIRAGVQAVNDWKERLGSEVPHYTNYFVITRDTYRGIPEYLDVAEKLKLGGVALGLPWFTDRAHGEEYQRIMRKQFGVEADSWKGWVLEEHGIDLDELESILNAAVSKDRSIHVGVGPGGAGPADVHAWFEDIDNLFGRTRCALPWLSGNILPNGDLSFCTDYPDYIWGNVFEGPLLEQWNGEKARVFRRFLQKRLFPVCHRCCAILGM